MSIAMIILNVLPNQWATPKVFKVVVSITMLFSIPDVIGYFKPEAIKFLIDVIPLASYNLGWLLPAFIAFFLTTAFESIKSKQV